MEDLLRQQAQFLKSCMIAKGIAEFEIYLESRKGCNLEVKNGQRDVFEVKNGLGYAIRIFENGRSCFFYGTDFSRLVVDDIIAKAQGALPLVTQDPCHKVVSAECRISTDLKITDPHFDKITFEEKLDFLRHLETLTHKIDKKKLHVQHNSLDDEKVVCLIENSAGLSTLQETTLYGVSLGILARAKKSEEVVYDMRSTTQLRDISPDEFVASTCEHALRLLGGKVLPSYRGPVLIDRDVIAELLEVLVQSFMGNQVFKGNSFLTKKLGEKIYSDKFSFKDAGLLEGAVGSRYFDDEGTVAQSTSLVAGGIVNHFLYNHYWAQRAKTISTANCRRESLQAVPGIGWSNLVMDAGSLSQNELFKHLSNGLWITDAIGVHNIDEVSGAFSVGVQGNVIQSGKIDKAFRGMVWTGNLHELFSSDFLLGNDVKLNAPIRCPSVLMDLVEISGQ